MDTNVYTNQVEDSCHEPAENQHNAILVDRTQLHSPNQSQVKSQAMSLNDLEFAYAPVRDQVRDLREYL
jgi:hypothetical protein